MIACVAQFFCGLASLTAASRMMFAFSRDGAVPGGRRYFRKVSRTHRVPVNAVMAIAALSWALMIPTYWNNTVGYPVGTSIAVIGLYIAYGVPIFLRLRAGDSFEPGAWTLGKHYRWINPIALVWILIIAILFLMPTVADGDPVAQRLRLERRQLRADHGRCRDRRRRRLVGVSARRWFKGPVVEGTEDELERLEAGFDTATPGGRLTFAPEGGRSTRPPSAPPLLAHR